MVTTACLRSPSQRTGVANWLVALGLVLTALCAAGPLAAADAPPNLSGRRLGDVIREFQTLGLELVYSTAVVDPELRIDVEPSSHDLRRRLDAILAPFGLTTRDGPGDAILILPGLPTATITGRVVSIDRERPIAAARVAFGSDDATLTDPRGWFHVDATIGPHDVTVSAHGYLSATYADLIVGADGLSDAQFVLTPLPTFATELMVTPAKHTVVSDLGSRGYSLTAAEAAVAPKLGGETSRIIGLLPGVAARDNSAELHIRGSAARDVAVVLDGLQLYDPHHFATLQSPFTVVDGSVVDSIDYSAGGYTVEHGDRHGGFVDVRTRPPAETATGELEVGTLNSRLTYSSPLKHGDLLASVRAWYPESIVDATELGAAERLAPRLADVYTKLTLPPLGAHRVSLHALFAYDNLSYDESDELVNESVRGRTRNVYLWARDESAWSQDLRTTTVLSVGRIERRRDGVASERGAVEVDDRRSVEFVGLTNDTLWRRSDAHTLKLGGSLRWLDADYRYRTLRLEDGALRPDTVDAHGASVAAYSALRSRPYRTLTTEIGLRWDLPSLAGVQWNPRFNVAWRPTATTELLASWGWFSQSQRLDELAVESRERDVASPERARQTELSFRQRLGDEVDLRIDAYHHAVRDLRPRWENLFEPIDLFPELKGDRVRLAPDRARLRGIELLLRSNATHPVFGWLGYTLSSAEDRFAGRVEPRSWDQTHAAKALVGYRVDSWSIVLSGSVHTGWPTTPVSAIADTDAVGGFAIAPGRRNSERLAPYVRFDLGARRALELGSGRLWINVELANLTDRKNPCCVNEFVYSTNTDGTIHAAPDYDHWLGFTPSVSLRWLP